MLHDKNREARSAQSNTASVWYINIKELLFSINFLEQKCHFVNFAVIMYMVKLIHVLFDFILN